MRRAGAMDPLPDAPAEGASTPLMWEARGAPKHYVSSKLMCWVSLDRGA